MASSVAMFLSDRETLYKNYASIAVFILTGLSMILAYPIWKFFNLRKYLSKIPGSYDKLPLVWIYMLHRTMAANTPTLDYTVSLYTCGTGILEIFKKNPLQKMMLGLQPFIVFTSYKSAEKVLSSSTMLEKRLVYEMLQPWLGTGLLTSNGEKWKARRRMLTPAFHFRILDDFIPIMNEHAFIFVEKLRSLCNREWIDIIPYTSRCTLDVICETAMGTTKNAQNEEDSEYVRAIKFVGEKLFSRVPRPWTWVDWIYFLTSEGREVKKRIKFLHDFTDSVIKSRKEEFLSNEEMLKKIRESTTDESIFTTKKRKAFLDLLLTRSYLDRSFTDKDIREEVDTFMFEGHDTTAMGISWALYMFGLYPEVQRKLHEEIDQIFGDDTTRPVTTDDMKEMKYLECCIKESQRIYPSVPIIGRYMLEDVEIEGYTIPKGSFCPIPIFYIQRDETVYPKPFEFIPERFLPENSVGRNPYAFIPFSAGPRNCIGQKFALNEEKIILANILRNFSFKSLDTQDKLQIAAELVLIPKNGLRLKFTPRRHS